MSNQLNFKTNIQLKSIIGKDLINDDNIAILELVKNAFDADAKKVTVKFTNLKNNDDATVDSFSEQTSRIIIQDDGLGMDLNDIINKWLNIAYSEKKTNNRQHKRLMAGAKGVGRFSCDRLGEYLNLYAKKASAADYIRLKIDWKQFEVEDDKKEIQSVTLEQDEINENELVESGIKPFEQGVALEIVKLRSSWAYPVKNNKNEIIDWNTDKFINLKKYLEKLINPNQAFENNDFGIYMDLPEFAFENSAKEAHDKFIGKVENRIFEQLDFKSTVIETKIIDNGEVIYTELKDKGNTIFWIKEKNIYYPFIDNAKILLYYLNPYSKAFFTKQTGIQSVNYGSIFLFVNGFRIPPYGEVGDDWLGIDQRKNQGTARYIGLRELVGSIEILDETNKFQIISSREGIVKNESYNKLTKSENNDSLVFKAFRRLERYVVDGISWDSIPDALVNNYREIEKKIISGETKEEDLVFREDDFVKRKRVYDSIHSIISARASNVIELYINEDLILDKINEEKRRSEREFEQLISDFENKKIDGDTLNQILLKKAKENTELEKQISEFTRYGSINEATSKALMELQVYKELTEKQLKLIEDLKEQLEKATIDKEEVQQELEKYKHEVEEANAKVNQETALRIEAEKERDSHAKEKEEVVTELKQRKNQLSIATSIASQDLNNVTNLHHQVRVISDNIKTQITLFSRKIEKGDTITKDMVKNFIDIISLENNKIESISKFGTRAIFENFTDSKEDDIVEFVENYVSKITNYFSNTKLKVRLNNEIKIPLFVKFKPLDISIIIDNMISNSKKADATILIITLTKNQDHYYLNFQDNGKGINKEIRDISAIYEKGFSTTKSTGLGLYHIKDILNENRWTITANTNLERGIEFSIQLK
jgi:signal transduction histidine kinase